VKIGDLVCYNAGGMKFKTLGLVLDIRTRPYRATDKEVLIQWAVTGKYMPRRGVGMPWDMVMTSGTIIWHEAGDWFEVVQ